MAPLKALIEKHWFFPVAIAANALGVLAFRHFVSLDGPMHLLHAAVERDAWQGVIRHAQGMWVRTDTMHPHLADLLLIPLTGVMSPFLLHKLLAAVAITCVCVGAWWLARAYDRTPNAAWLLVLPCAFGFVVVLGLFHFIIAIGIAFYFCGWWVTRPTIDRRQLVTLLAGCALASFAHGSGGPFLVLLVCFHEFAWHRCVTDGWRARWSRLPRRLPLILLSGSIGVVLLVFALRSPTSPVPAHEPHHPLRELITLRSLLLLDSHAERVPRIVLGSLIVLLLAAAAWGRRGTRKPAPSDALLFAAVFLFLSSFIQTPRTELLYIADRAQWLGLLLIACWLSTQELPARLILISGLFIVSIHALRVVYAEKRMHLYQERDSSVLEAAARFEPGAFIVPVVLDDDWLARHRTAYAAIGHKGLLFTGRDHLFITWDSPPVAPVRNYIFSPENNWDWIGRHIRKGSLPHLEQILIIGSGTERSAQRTGELRSTLQRYYHPVYQGANAGLWTFTGPD